MERGSKKWCFRGNEELHAASAITIRGVRNMLMQNLDEADKRPTVPLGHGDPSVFPSFHTTHIAEDAIVNALRSAKFNCYAPTVGIPPARRSKRNPSVSRLGSDLVWAKAHWLHTGLGRVSGFMHFYDP
ncbi:hypothetical protein L1049_024836 [Liquidambar formosana]|uniref:Uncharacterized protein n=1 Tax=Liquidambar formosana TaxID=63359 RepID=A0AAP0X558_LIQFO